MSDNISTLSPEPVCTPQCMEVDEVHGGNHLDLIVTPGGSEEWVRNIATEFTPTIRQTFASLDEGIQFYETYAIACGFEPRRSSTKRFRNSGDIRTKLIVCHREGFRDSKPTILSITGAEEEPMDKAYEPRNTKVTRIGCKARIFFKCVIKEIDKVQVPFFVVDQFHAAHNHLLYPLKYTEFLKKRRNLNIQHKQTIIDNCKVNRGPTSTFRSVKEYVDGYENIGATLIDFKNFGRRIKCFIGLKDAQMFIDQLEVLAQTRKGFYYAHQIDKNKCLFRVFWADAEARRNYSLYGDTVSYDPTYSTNRYDMIFAPFTGVDHHNKSVTFGGSLMSRENDQNFKWIFTKFLDAMGGKQPNCFFTDQCPAMKTAVPAVFTTSAHRYCMWHIMKKLPEKVGTTFPKDTDFVTRLNSVVWDSDLEPCNFEEKWCALITEFQMQDNKWLKYLFAKRHRWIPAYYRDIPLGCLLRTTQRSESENSFFKRFENPNGTLVEFWMRFQSAMDQQRYSQKCLDRDSDHSLPITKTLLSLEAHASTVYTHALFYEFQQQCIASLHSCSAGDSSREGSVRYLDVEDSIFNKTYTVAFNPTTFDATCSCKMFERKGYICKHIIWILSGKGAKKIPDQYLLSRWTKNSKKMPLYDAHGQLLDDFDSSDLTKFHISSVWSEFYSTLTLIRTLPQNHIKELSELLKTFRQKFNPGLEKMTPQQEMEMLLGVKSSTEIRILPPVQSKNKGSGKRLTSKQEQSIAKAQKPKRFCNNCKQMAHHDKRNCPNPAVDTSQQPFDHESEISSLVDDD